MGLAQNTSIIKFNLRTVDSRPQVLSSGRLFSTSTEGGPRDQYTLHGVRGAGLSTTW